MSARRKTEKPPSRPSGGAEGDSPLGWDAEEAAGGPSGPFLAPRPSPAAAALTSVRERVAAL